MIGSNISLPWFQPLCEQILLVSGVFGGLVSVGLIRLWLAEWTQQDSSNCFHAANMGFLVHILYGFVITEVMNLYYNIQHTACMGILFMYMLVLWVAGFRGQNSLKLSNSMTWSDQNCPPKGEFFAMIFLLKKCIKFL